LIAEIGDIQIPRAIDRDRSGQIQFRAGRGAAITAEALRAIARHGADVPPQIYFANAIIGPVGNVKVARTVKANARREIQFRAGCRAGLGAGSSGIARSRAVAGHRCDVSGLDQNAKQSNRDRLQIHGADALIVGIGNEKVAGAVKSDGLGEVQFRG